MSRDVRKRLEFAKQQITVAIIAFDRVIKELERCKADLLACVNAKHTDFYRCPSCDRLREKGEACENRGCKDFGGRK